MVFLDLAKILLRRLALHGLQDLRAVFLHLSLPQDDAPALHAAHRLDDDVVAECEFVFSRAEIIYLARFLEADAHNRLQPLASFIY